MLRVGSVVCCAAFLLSGCQLLETEGDPETVDLTVNWAVKDAASGATTPCPGNYKTVWIVAQPRDADGGDPGDPFWTKLDCGSGSASSTATLYQAGVVTRTADSGSEVKTDTSGRYVVWMLMTEPTGEIIRTESIRTPVDLRGGSRSLDVSLYPDGGLYLMSWTLYSKVGGRPVTCDAVGVTEIEHRYRLFEDETAPLTVDRFRCADSLEGQYIPDSAIGNGLSRPLPAGDYVGTAYALANGAAISSTETSMHIEDKGHLTEGGAWLDLDR
jgi:hypothetical protein